MSTVSLLQEFGISPEDVDIFSNDPKGLIKLREVFESHCNSLKGTTTLNKEEIDKYKEQAKKNPTAQEAVKNIMSDIRENVYEAFDNESDSLILFIEDIDEFLSILKFEMKELINNVGKTQADVALRNKDTEAKYETLLQLKKLLDSVWLAQKPNLKLTNKEFAAKKDDGTHNGFPLKDSKAEGLVPDLPRMPDKPGGEKKGKGRPIHSANLRMRWNGDDVPNTMNLAEVCKSLVSNRKAGVHVTFRDVKKSLEEMSKDISKDSWELTYDTGKLEGWIEKSQPVVSSGKK